MRRSAIAGVGVACVFLAWGGCGGTAVVDGDSAAGGSGTGTGSGTSTGSPTGTGTGTATPSGAGGCGPTAVCPAEVPTHGDDCTCQAGLKCSYGLCEESSEQLSATCDGSTWSVSNEICGPVYCPDEFLCGENEVCLVTMMGWKMEFGCAANPCPTQPLGCECASSLCPGVLECLETKPGQVTCECGYC